MPSVALARANVAPQTARTVGPAPNERAHPGAPVQVIDRAQLRKLIREEGIDNTRAAEGVALVNVLRHALFRRARIPGSINIPAGCEGEFGDRFRKEKMIVLYSGSRTCPAPLHVARNLSVRGFRRVLAYESGLEDWRASGGPVVSGHV